MSVPKTASNAEIISLENIHRLCRICLTENFSLISMDCPLCNDSPHEPSILEALEKVMSIKLINSGKYPSQICSVCKSCLKVAYDLNVMFNNSQNTLSEYFQDTLLVNKLTPVAHRNFSKFVAPVELICGTNKYDLNDVMIVESEKEEKQNFQGFLNNLGKSVSAVFVNKPNTYKKCDKVTKNDNVNYNIPVFFNNTEDKNDTIIELSLEELQEGCNISDFFVDNQLFALMHENEVNTVETENLQLSNNIVEQNTDKENIILRKIYKCDACNVLCANKTRLKLHLKRKHADLTPYLCERCASVSFYQDGDPKPESDLICCEDCGSADTKRKITSKIAMGKTGNKCQICGHISKSSSNAKYHKMTHYEPQQQCNICDKKYRTKAQLQWHINSHRNVKNLLCSVCGKKFSYNSALIYHMRTHTDDRKYLCEICDKKFYMQSSWKQHMRRHAGVKPYNCNYCEKLFITSRERKKHEMIHTGQRPYKCLYCDKAFISNFNRQCHYMSHSGPHACDYCPRTFIDVDFLRKHIQSRHTL